MMIDLSGRVALVTGGSRGIGAATARLLGRAGAAVAITYRQREADASRTAAELRAAGVDVRCFQCDLSTADGGDRCVAETVREFGRLSIVVANAGVWPPTGVAVEEMTNAQWRDTIAVNLDGVFGLTRAALRVIEDDGRVVIVTSTASQRGEAYHADYAASKGALNAFVKSVAVEAAPKVTVNAVAPGWVDTDMCAIPFNRDAGQGRAAIEAEIPLRRVATPDDIAGPIVFLCSDLSRHVTGEVLNVNGGSVLCG